MGEIKKRKKYSPEFKAEAIKLAESTSFSHTSKELGVSIASLRNWIVKSANGPTSDPSKPSYGLATEKWQESNTHQFLGAWLYLEAKQSTGR